MADDKPTFKRSQLRDVRFYRENEKAIEEAARQGRIVDDVTPARHSWLERQPATPPAPEQKTLPRRGGSEIAGGGAPVRRSATPGPLVFHKPARVDPRFRSALEWFGLR